eukprot:1532928-Prymnesium_polylepis.1
MPLPLPERDRVDCAPLALRKLEQRRHRVDARRQDEYERRRRRRALVREVQVKRRQLYVHLSLATNCEIVGTSLSSRMTRSASTCWKGVMDVTKSGSMSKCSYGSEW